MSQTYEPKVRCILVTLLGLLTTMATALAAPNSPNRVRAFARLPDWSGMWVNAVYQQVGASGRLPGGEAQLRATLELIREPPYNAEWAARYAAGMKDTAALAAKSATFKICARSFPSLMEAPWMFQLLVLPEETLILFENGQVRHVYTDGRSHPSRDDLWATPLGDSIGRWEGGTLVVETIARTASEPLAPRAWVSMLSEQAQFTERLSRVDADHFQDDLTIDDPVALAHPWRISLKFTRVKELDRMIPTDCVENDRNPVVDGKTIIVPP